MYAPPNKPDRDVNLISDNIRADIRAQIHGQTPWPLVLLGPCGTGKTCAALCMIDRFGGWYVTVQEFLRRLIDAEQGNLFSSGYPSHQVYVQNIWADWERAHLVILDELGSRNQVSDHHYDNIKLALDKRLNFGKPIVVCSNLSLDQIGKVYDDRMASRLAGGTVIEFVGTDRRLT